MSPSKAEVARTLLRGKHLSLVFLALGLTASAAVGLASPSSARLGRAPAAPASAARTPARAPLARAQAGNSAKQLALAAERALLDKNAADAARAEEIRAKIDALAVKMDKPTVGKRRLAKLQTQHNALAAELAAVDLSIVTALPRATNESEPNDDAMEATALTLAPEQLVVASGSVASPGDVDLYTFDAPAGARVWAYVDASASALTGTGSHDSVLRLLDRDGVGVLAEGDDGASGSNFGRRVNTVLASAVANVTVPESGHFFLEVRAFDPATTMDSYKLVLVVSTAQPQPETAANESATSATPLVPATTTTGVVAAALERAGDVDFYSVEAKGSRPLFVSIDGDPDRTGTATSVTLELLNRDLGTVLRTVTTNGSPSQTFAIVAPSTGTFYLRVAGATASTTGKYTVAGAVGSPNAASLIPTDTICGDTSTSTTKQDGSLKQNGIASTCATTKACPGVSGPMVKFVSFSFPTDTVDQCVTLSASSTCSGNSRAVIAAYLNSFDPNNICSTFLGDPGAQLGSATPVSFSVLVPAGDTLIIVVNAAKPGNDCGAFCFDVNSVACTVMCPDPIEVGTDPSDTQCGANVTFEAGSACGGTATCMANGSTVVSGDFFPVGTTTVTCTGSSGEGDMCSFTITVNDTTGPLINCPADISATSSNQECTAVVEYTTPTATDACAMDPVDVVCDPPSGSTFSAGVTTVTCTATDLSENQTQCTFTVTVSGDLSITCPDNITVGGTDLVAQTTCAGGAGSVVEFPDPDVMSAVCNGEVTVVCEPASGSVFPVGTTTVTCTATDENEQTASCMFTVTVESDSIQANFGACYVDDYTGDTFSQVIDPNDPLFGFWQYHVQATGLTICGFAEFLSYIPGHSHISYDNDASDVWMDTNVNLGAGTAVIQVNTFSPNVRYVLRDRNIFNDPPCATEEPPPAKRR